jgi:hypothetical protein
MMGHGQCSKACWPRASGLLGVLLTKRQKTMGDHAAFCG